MADGHYEGVAGEPRLKSSPSGLAKRASAGQIRWLGCGLIVLALLLAYLLVLFWPSDLSAQSKGNEMSDLCPFGAARCIARISVDAQLFLVVMIAGGLGSFVHTATSFGDFVGNEKLTVNWMWWYILKPFIGMALAVIFYMVMRGGLLSSGSNAGSINLFGIAALAGLTGMFSKQATDKLSEVFDALFRTRAGGGDAKRKDDLNNPVPILLDLDPTSIEPATRNVIVTVKGTGFVSGSVVRLNGANRETEFRDSTRLLAKLLPDDVAAEGQLEVFVVSPPPGGGASTPLKIKVAAAQAQPPAAAREAKASPAAVPLADTVDTDAHVDGCDVEITDVTADEALPASRGGVAI